MVRRFLWLLLSVSTIGCSGGTPVGGCDDGSCGPCGDGGCPSDAGRHPAAERCDGLDDDGDGRIDEGCPCAAGEMQACWPGSTLPQGACRLGTMTCQAVPGMEFVQWGDSRCEGAVLPAAAERCDGSDADCDGAVDEGCGCRDGEERVCAGSHLGVCTASTQRCADGAWSTCTDAVGPFEEVCGDGVDGDCDGTVDEGCGCGPVEACGPVNLDAPSFVDEREVGDYVRLRHAFMGDRVASVVVRTIGAFPYELEYALVVSHPDGTEATRGEPFLNARPIESAGYDEVVRDLLWTGTELWVLVQQLTDTRQVRRRVAVRRFDADARPLGEPVVLAGGESGSAFHPVALMLGDRVQLGWAECDDADLYRGPTEHRHAWDNRSGGCVRHRVVVQARDHALRALDEPLVVHRTELLWGIDLGRFAFTDGTLGLTWADVEVSVVGTGAQIIMRTWLGLLRDGAVLARRDHPIPTDAGGGGGYRLGHGSTTLSAGAGVFLACESIRFDAMTCQRHDTSGTSLGARFDTSRFDTKTALDTTWSGCDFLLATIGDMAEPPTMFLRSTHRIDRLDPRSGTRTSAATLETDYNAELSDDIGTYRDSLDTNNAFTSRRLWLEGPSLPMLVTPMTRVYSTPERRVLRRNVMRPFSCR